MAFDSPLLIAAAALFAACVFAWALAAPLRIFARIHLRFAAMLLAAFAVCAILGLADVAALFLLPLAAGCLALSALARFARTPPAFIAAPMLVLALAAGLGGMLFDRPMFSLVPVALAGLVVVAAALNALVWRGVLAGAALLAPGLIYLQQGAGAGVLLFCAAALMGLAPPAAVARRSAFAVEQCGDLRRASAIGLR